MNFTQCRENLRQPPSTFCEARRCSVNFCQLTVRLENLPSTYCQLFVHPGDLPSTAVYFRVAWRLLRTARNFPCGQEAVCQPPSNLRVAKKPSINFCQIFIQLEDFASTGVNYLLGLETFLNFRQHFVWPVDPLSTSINLCAARTPSVNFRQFFCEATGLFVTFHQITAWPQDLSISINYLCDCRTFYQLSVRLQTVRQLPSTF